MTEKRGTVYVLTNESFEGLVKIGFTTRTAEKRAKELSNTSTPHPFKVYYETPPLTNYRETERAAHAELAALRVTNGREFFRTEPENAQKIIQNIIGGKKRTHTIVVPRGVEEITLKFDGVSLGP